MVGIKYIEMPKSCTECKLLHSYFDLDGVIHYICKCDNMELCGDLNTKRNGHCPLIYAGEDEKQSIPYLMHKEMGIPLSECQKAYDVAIEYLRKQGKVNG